jgi:hypothetical protein
VIRASQPFLDLADYQTFVPEVDSEPAVLGPQLVMDVGDLDGIGDKDLIWIQGELDDENLAFRRDEWETQSNRDSDSEAPEEDGDYHEQEYHDFTVGFSDGDEASKDRRNASLEKWDSTIFGDREYVKNVGAVCWVIPKLAEHPLVNWNPSDPITFAGDEFLNASGPYEIHPEPDDIYTEYVAEDGDASDAEDEFEPQLVPRFRIRARRGPSKNYHYHIPEGDDNKYKLLCINPIVVQDRDFKKYDQCVLGSETAELREAGRIYAAQKMNPNRDVRGSQIHNGHQKIQFATTIGRERVVDADQFTITNTSRGQGRLELTSHGELYLPETVGSHGSKEVNIKGTIEYKEDDGYGNDDSWKDATMELNDRLTVQLDPAGREFVDVKGKIVGDILTNPGAGGIVVAHTGGTVQIATQLDHVLKGCSGTFTSEPYLECETVTAETKDHYTLDNYREEIYSERFTAFNSDMEFRKITFNDVRVLEGFNHGIVYITTTRASRDFEMETALGDQLLGWDLKRIQVNEKNCLLDNTPPEFLFDQFNKIFPKRYTFKQWSDTKQVLVFNHETLAIKLKPSEQTMSNLSITIKPKLSKYWKRITNTKLWPGRTDGHIEAIEFKAVLVLVYKNREIQIQRSGDIQERQRTAVFRQATPQIPKITVPIASGGDALAHLKLS